MDKRYQVFISSTFADLKEERKGIMQAIIELDCFPAGMEMFPATDSEQFEYIKTIIDESDYYVLIVAGRYGSVAEDGVSYTEKEFDYAKKKGIPILAFVKKDIENITVKKTDQDLEKQEKLELFRNKALDGRMANFWDTADELKYKIHSSLSKQFKTHPRIGWVKGDTIPRYEALEQLNQLQEENKQLANKLQDFEISNDNSSRISKSFEIKFIEKDTFDLIKKIISIKDIINKTGLSLRIGLWESDFEVMINNRFINDDLITEGFITEDSLEEIEKKMLALDIVNLRDVSSDVYMQFTDYGNKVFIQSIEF